MFWFMNYMGPMSKPVGLELDGTWGVFRFLDPSIHFHLNELGHRPGVRVPAGAMCLGTPAAKDHRVSGGSVRVWTTWEWPQCLLR